MDDENLYEDMISLLNSKQKGDSLLATFRVLLMEKDIRCPIYKEVIK